MTTEQYAHFHETPPVPEGQLADHGQRGQSIVIIAFAMIGILAFVGIAVDVGLVFARSTQLQAAVDSAALAGVTELAAGSMDRANTKAAQFLNGNGLPISATQTLVSNSQTSALSATEYQITVTWPVDLYFLRLVGQEEVAVTRSATAAFFPQADIYASRRIEDGALSTSNQGIFGPHICTSYGDPFSPLTSPWEPGFYTYEYRILIPADYPDDVVRVELFDPDSINSDVNTATIFHTDRAIALGDPDFEIAACGGNQRDPCLLDTGEDEYIDGVQVSLDSINPFWFMRIDENRGAGAAPGNGSCGNPGSYNEAFNTQTVYQLFYYVENSDGTVQRVNLAKYTGQTGDGRDTLVHPTGTPGDHETDMRWVSPGGAMSYDQTTFVPIDPGSPKTFELNIAEDMPNILEDAETSDRYLYLDVTTISGASENGFEIWAGPPSYTATVSSDVNLRNIQVLNEPGVHHSKGVTVFGMGRLPMNSNIGNRVDIPLVYVGPEYAGQSVFVSLFDTDSGASPPIHFFFDSLAQEDWQLTFADGGTDPDGVNSNSRCKPGGCDNKWVTPPYEIVVPGDLEDCDWSDPDNDAADCTPFYGGRLTANYDGGNHDTYGWEIMLSGLPFLIK